MVSKSLYSSCSKVLLLFRDRQVELLVLLGCFGASFFFWPFTQDDYGSFMINMASGQFSNFSLIDWYFLGYTGFNSVYKALHTIIPKINWLGLGTYIMSVLGFYLSLRVVVISIRQIVSKTLIWLSTLCFGLFYLDSFISIAHTRASLIMCGGASFYLLLIPKIGIKKTLLLNLIFIIGLLHRGESAIGVLWIAGLTSLLFSFSFRHLIHRLGPPILFTSLFFLSISIYWASSSSFLVKVEPEIEYEFMSGNVIDLSKCQTEKDSVKYLMATYGIWIDPKVVTAEYMRTLILNNRFSFEQLHYGLMNIKKYLVFYSGLSFLLFISIGFLITKKRSLISGLKLLLYLILNLLPLLYSSYRTLLDERHFFPIVFILVVLAFIYSIQVYSKENLSLHYSHLTLSLILFLGALSNYYLLNNYKNRNEVEEVKVICSENTMNQIESMYSNRIVVITSGSFRLIDHDFSIWTKNYSANTYIMYDLFNYSLVPRYTEYLSLLCNCDATKPEIFFTWLSQKNALYLAENNRLDITKSYMKALYNQELQFLPVKEFKLNSCLKNHDSYLKFATITQVKTKNE